MRIDLNIIDVHMENSDHVNFKALFGRRGRGSEDLGVCGRRPHTWMFLSHQAHKCTCMHLFDDRGEDP